MARRALIVGCGYTGQRVARLLSDGGWDVTATTRNVASLSSLAEAGVRVARLDLDPGPDTGDDLPSSEGACVLLSVPTLRREEGLGEPTPRLVAALKRSPRRVVYLSTTGVYGETQQVDAETAIAPVTARQQLRAAAEQAVRQGPWPSLVLRPAAIYGPGRGVHEAMRRGEFRLMGDGRNFVSRIHVDDLAAITTAAMASDLTGAFPVADDCPAISREIAEFCAGLLGVENPASVEAGDLSETRRADRRVDGSTIRELLGVRLKYPSYREGIRAALARAGNGVAS